MANPHSKARRRDSVLLELLRNKENTLRDGFFVQKRSNKQNPTNGAVIRNSKQIRGLNYL